MLTFAIIVFVMLMIVGVITHSVYITRVRDEFPKVYEILDRPSVFPTAGMFYLGANNRLWRHFIKGENSESLPNDLQKLRAFAGRTIWLQYPAFGFLVIAIILN